MRTARFNCRATAALMLAAAIILGAGCGAGGGSTTMPDALWSGTWSKTGGQVAELTFSDQGRVDIVLQDGTACSGTYEVVNASDTAASVRSGYISCPPMMDGYATNEARIDGGDLVLDGTWGGRYTR